MAMDIALFKDSTALKDSTKSWILSDDKTTLLICTTYLPRYQFSIAMQAAA
jgi:hypothetical protein